jgi:hypothetical protein
MVSARLDLPKNALLESAGLGPAEVASVWFTGVPRAGHA